MSEGLKRVIDAIEQLACVQSSAARAEAVAEAKRTAELEIGGLEGEIADNKERIAELEEAAACKSGDIADAANSFIDEIERPVGTLHFHVPQTESVDRALLGLHDAIGRRL